MTVTSTSAGSAAPPTRRPGRIVSLDVARGVLLVVSLVVAGWTGPKPEMLRHAEWTGVNGVDLVFPLFVTLSGCGLAFAYRNRVGWRATTRRVLVLALAALAFSAVLQQTLDPTRLKVTGPLMVYAVLVLVIAVLHRVATTARAWMVVTALVALGQLVLLLTWQAGCPGDALTPACNPSRGIDFALLGETRIYHEGLYGHDPEGLPSILGALVTASVGVAAGHLALTARTLGAWRGAARIVAWAAVVALAAHGSAQVLPAMKRLWTSPFALGVAAAGIVVLAVCMLLLDSPAARSAAWVQRLVWPLVALGRNSLLVYFGSHVVADVAAAHGDPPWSEQWAARLSWLGDPPLGLVIATVATWTALAALLHWRRIYLRP